MSLNLDEPCTQAQFGEVIGVTQQAVAEMIARETLTRGDTLGQWLIAYCGGLRLVAAGRDSDLAYERAIDTRVRRERNEIQLELDRKTYAAVPLLEQVLATVGRKVAGVLDPLPGQISKLSPSLTPEDLVLIQRAVSQACDLAAGAALSVLDEPEEEGAELATAGAGDGLDEPADEDEA